MIMDKMHSTTTEPDLWSKDILEAILEHKWETVHQYLHEVECVDEDSWTILHWSCREYYTPLDTINLLLNAYPLAAAHPDVNGCVPLHIALEYHKPLEVIESLVKACPVMLSIADGKGKTPLHTACNADSNTPLEVIEFLIKEYPEVALEKDVLGRTPLDEALCSNSEDEVIELLLRYCPDCASITDEKDFNTPLHLAVNHNRSVRVMRALVECMPSLISSPNVKKQTAADLFYRKWNRPVTNFIESLSPSANPCTIWNTPVTDFPTQYVHDIACFFLQPTVRDEISTTAHKPTLHSAIKSEQCPWSFCELFLRLHPHQSIEHDSQRTFPIELIPNISKRKFYEPQTPQRARIIEQLKSNYKDGEGGNNFLLMRFLLRTTKSNFEEVKMVNFLFNSIRENPVICASRKKRKPNGSF